MTKTSKFLTRDQLLTARPPKIVEVEVDGVGTARIRALRAAEREELDSLSNRGEKPDYRLYRARAVALALLDENDQPFFENPMNDANKLLQQLLAVELDVLFAAVDSISALTKRSQEALGKGSQTTTSTGS